MTTARKDPEHITPDGRLIRSLIEGSVVRDSAHIVTGNGITTEIHRADWGIVDGPPGHPRRPAPGALSAWHMHKLKTDHVFCLSGHLRVAL